MADKSVVIFTLPDGRVVFQRRTQDAPTNPGKLGLFGGHIEWGESPMQALIREICEETGIVSTASDIKFMTKLGSEGGYVFVFKAAILNADFPVYEGDGAEVYTVAEALARDDLTHNTHKAVHLL